MISPEKIASALEQARAAADKYDAHILTSQDLNRQDREILVAGNWLQEITKGWYMLTRPDLATGDSAAWYANFWDFLRVYLQQRYDKNYCLSAEASLALHTGSTLAPQQIIIMVPEGGTLLQLPYETSLMTYADANNIPEDRIVLNGLQCMTLSYALCKVTPSYFRHNSENIEIALRSLTHPDLMLRTIIENNFQRAAERIIGAYDYLGMDNEAKQMAETLKTVGMKVIASNPFKQATPLLNTGSFHSPYGARISLLWEKYRDSIINYFPDAPGLPSSSKKYISRVDELYEYDAYNSLSIEGYQVSPELIHRVRNNHWSPDTYADDREQHNALAARGYYEAFQAVKETLNDVLQGKQAGQCITDDLTRWYQQLFSPSAKAGILTPTDLIGYRKDRVYIRNSRHAPPPKESLLDCMDAFFNCLKQEDSAAVRAVLGHYVFVFIHPYMDGNGRLARFILNTMLASGGYPWTIVQVKRRKQYIDSLEHTHVEDDISMFTQFIIEEMIASETFLDTNN